MSAAVFAFAAAGAESLSSKGHGSLTATSSGIATPFLVNDSSTPSSGTAVDSRELTAKNLEDVNEKLQRKPSFTKAVLSSVPPTRTPAAADGGTTKEHSEQGRVKKDVYLQYIEAASKIGFAIFVVSTILSQVVSVAANNTLRAWGEHNREEGSNKGVGKYLLGYGLFSLSSTLLGAASAILIWVFCSIRSARRLHDSVCVVASLRDVAILTMFTDVVCCHACTDVVLRADPDRKVCVEVLLQSNIRLDVIYSQNPQLILP